MNLRGENCNVVLSLVREAEEKNSGIFGQRSRKPRPIFYAGGWLEASEEKKRYFEVAKRCAALAVTGKFRGILSQFRRVASRPVAESDIYAKKVRVKNNVLALYPDDGLVCKIQRPKTIREVDALYTEYTTLQKIAAFEGLDAPEPLAYHSEPVPTLWLKYIDHKPVTKQEKHSIALNIAEMLMRWYDHCGVKIITSKTYSPLLDILQGGVAALRQKGWNAEEASVLLSALENAAELNMPLLQSQIHGDASTGNAMIGQNGKLIITDWETSRTDLIAIDMVKLFQDAPEISQLYLGWRSGYEKSTAVDVQRELLLVRMLRGLNLNDKWHYYTAVTSYTKSEAENRIAVDKRSIIDACGLFRG